MKKQIAAFLLAAGLGAVPAAFAQDKMPRRQDVAGQDGA